MLQDKRDRQESQLDQVRKSNDDILWFTHLADFAELDKVILTGLPNPKGKERYGIKNERHPLCIYQYVFIPRKLDKAKNHPAIVLAPE